MTRRLAALFRLIAMGSALPLLAADGPSGKGPKQPFEVSQTERVDFQPGGTIRVEKSYGYLTVEGWDEPAVEITVTKSTNRFYEPGQKAKAEKRLAEIGVADDRLSDKELEISTVTPVRHIFISSILPARRIVITLPKHTQRGVTVDYTVRVPRDSRLAIHHDDGYVWVGDVAGDIEVDSHTGDMILMLPDPGAYSIDARTRLGGVTSDFTGSAKTLSQFLVGTHFTYVNRTPAHRIHLRMGRGSITIKNGPPSGPFWKGQV